MNPKDLTTSANSPIETEQNAIIVRELSSLYEEVKKDRRQVFCYDSQIDSEVSDMDLENLQFKLFQLGLVPLGSDLQGFKIFTDLEEEIFMFGLDARFVKDGRPWNVRVLIEQDENEAARDFKIVTSKEYFKIPEMDPTAFRKNELLLDTTIFLIHLFNKDRFKTNNEESVMESKKLQEDLAYLEQSVLVNEKLNFRAGKACCVSLDKNDYGEILLTLREVGEDGRLNYDDYVFRIRRWRESFFFKKRKHYEIEGKNRSIPKNIDPKELTTFHEMIYFAINGLNARYVKSLTQ